MSSCTGKLDIDGIAVKDLKGRRIVIAKLAVGTEVIASSKDYAFYLNLFPCDGEEKTGMVFGRVDQEKPISEGLIFDIGTTKFPIGAKCGIIYTVGYNIVSYRSNSFRVNNP
ncbi:MAG: hypothetical protein K2X76_01750 [Sphingomonas sp.]|nr:hypothetical protein [Sphingomonas sp.]